MVPRVKHRPCFFYDDFHEIAYFGMWIKFKSIPTFEGEVTVAAINNIMMVCDLGNGHCFLFDPGSFKWEQIASVLADHKDFQLVSCGKNILTIGGTVNGENTNLMNSSVLTGHAFCDTCITKNVSPSICPYSEPFSLMPAKSRQSLICHINSTVLLS